MGAGIAVRAAMSGQASDVIERDETGVGAAKLRIAEGAARAHLPREAESLIHVTSSWECCSRATFCIESVYEDPVLKHEILVRLANVVGEHVILASNTSSLSITVLATGVVNPERVVGMHFFNPVPVSALCEIVQGKLTQPQTCQAVAELATSFGLEPIVVQDSPGFASSRLGLALGLEAIRMLEEGVASASDIDLAMCKGYRHPIGPLKLTDLIGLDVRLAIAEYLSQELGERFAPPQLLRAKVARKELGKKTGQGFYAWD